MTTFQRRVAMVAVILGVAFATGACSKKEAQAEKKPMTKDELDRAIAKSKVPGANVVGKALEVSDSAKVRANQPIPEPR
jgi:hypothetical protein